MISTFAQDEQDAVARGDHELTVEDHGSIFLIHAKTSDGLSALVDEVGDGATWFGNALAVEHRFVADAVMHLIENGFVVVAGN